MNAKLLIRLKKKKEKKKENIWRELHWGCGEGWEGIFERSQRQHCQKLIWLIQSTKISDCEKLQDFNSSIQLRVSLDSNYHSLKEKKAANKEKKWPFMESWHLNPVRLDNAIIRVYYLKQYQWHFIFIWTKWSQLCKLNCLWPTGSLVILGKCVLLTRKNRYYNLTTKPQHVLGLCA